MDNTFLHNLKWRRSEKHFAPGKVDTKLIDQAIINAPSSYGMQPYHVFKITNKKLKEKLSPACYDQAQVKECYALYVFCAYTNLEKRMDQYIKLTKGESKRESIKTYLSNLPTKVGWAKQQAYIALGYGLAAATELKIASCPMEGFMPDKVAKVLGLDNSLDVCVLFAVGRHQPESKDYTLEPRFRFKDIIEKM